MKTISALVRIELEDNPKFCSDDGVVDLANSILSQLGLNTIEDKAFKILATTIRVRNKYLSKHPELDLRKNNKKEIGYQMTIYDVFMETFEIINQERVIKAFKRFTKDKSKLQENVRATKNSIRGISDAEILAGKNLASIENKKVKYKK